MALWMGYALLVGALAAAAAHVAERALRGRGCAGRHAWTVGLVVSVVLPVSALVLPSRTAPPSAGPGAGAGLPMDLLSLGLRRLPAVPPLLDRIDPWLIGFWIVGTLLLGGAVFGGLIRISLRARRWPSAPCGSGTVLLSDDFGPALLGVGRSRVVVPRWTLSLAPEQLRLVVLHEEEHRAAGDARVLMAAALAVVAAPWNLALWWQLRRLRAAVELDCDARMIARGASPAAYGALLLQLGTRLPGLPLSLVPVAALSHPSSLLERRLRMIVRGTKRYGRAKVLTATGGVVLLLALACEAPAPTALRPQSDAEGATPAVQTNARTLGEVVDGAAATNPLVVVDGKRMQEKMTDVFAGMDKSSIERIEVIKGAAARQVYGADGANGVIRITTKTAADRARAEEERLETSANDELRKHPPRLRGASNTADRWVTTGEMPSLGDTVTATGVTGLGGIPTGLVTVDGKPFHGDLSTLDATTIDHIDVIKGAGRGAGQIHIVTRKAARGGREQK